MGANTNPVVPKRGVNAVGQSLTNPLEMNEKRPVILLFAEVSPCEGGPFFNRL